MIPAIKNDLPYTDVTSGGLREERQEVRSEDQ